MQRYSQVIYYDLIWKHLKLVFAEIPPPRTLFCNQFRIIVEVITLRRHTNIKSTVKLAFILARRVIWWFRLKIFSLATILAARFRMITHLSAEPMQMPRKCYEHNLLKCFSRCLPGRLMAQSIFETYVNDSPRNSSSATDFETICQKQMLPTGSDSLWRICVFLRWTFHYVKFISIISRHSPAQ